MDRELTEMQRLADSVSGVRLSRPAPPRPQPEHDALLILGLALVLLTDSADLLSAAALLYLLS